MALEATESVNLSGQSAIDEKTMVCLSASVSTESVGNVNISQTTQDVRKYRENRTQCREDIQSSQDKVYEVEDQLATELAKKEMEEVEEL